MIGAVVRIFIRQTAGSVEAIDTLEWRIVVSPIFPRDFPSRCDSAMRDLYPVNFRKNLELDRRTGVYVRSCSAFRGSHRFTATVSIRQRQVGSRTAALATPSRNWGELRNARSMIRRPAQYVPGTNDGVRANALLSRFGRNSAGRHCPCIWQDRPVVRIQRPTASSFAGGAHMFTGIS
jgi:hypothetical protein